MPKVSIILPNYNHAEFLPARLKSLADQTFTDIELIILDDASTDCSLALLREYRDSQANVTLIEHSENIGKPFMQWQLGLQASKGEYIWIAESDDVADASFLSKLIPSLDNNPEVLLVACDSIAIDAQQNETGQYKLDNREVISSGEVLAGRQFIESNMCRLNSLPNVSAIVFRREALDSLDKQVLSLSYIGDWLFYLKVLCKGDIVYHTEALNYFRTHQATTRSEQTKDWQQLGREFKQIYRFMQDAKVSPGLNLVQILANIDYLDNLLENISNSDLMQSNKRLAIYGAGALGLYCADLLRHDYAVACFIDQKHAEFQGSKMAGTPVISLTQFQQDYPETPVLIASLAYYDEISQVLADVGLANSVLNVRS